MKRLVKSSTIEANRVDELLDIVDDAFAVDASINAADVSERKVIRLTSIPGVTRNKDGDYRDDGTSFQGYLYKGVVPISYAKHGNDIYISVAFHHMDSISYDEYKQFPSYQEGDRYNGVPSTEFDSVRFQEILESAYNDIQDFTANVIDVDDSDIESRIAVLNEASAAYKAKVDEFIRSKSSKIMTLEDYQFKKLKGYVQSAGTHTADYIREASQSGKREFLRKDIEQLKSQISSEWNFKYIEELLGE